VLCLSASPSALWRGCHGATPRRRPARVIFGGFPRQLRHRVRDLSAYATKMRVPLLRANMIVEHLTARGVMDPRLLYESPFTDLDPLGVAGIFAEGEVVELVRILRDVEGRAAA